MTSTRLQLARRLLDIIPLVMRVMAAEIRTSKHAAAAGHVSLLGMLSHRPYTLKELATSHAVSSPTMSSTVSTLEERGWVKREHDQEDRRVVWVSITPEGKRVLGDMQDETAQRIAALLEGVSIDEQHRLIEDMTVLRDVFAAALDRGPNLLR